MTDNYHGIRKKIKHKDNLHGEPKMSIKAPNYTQIPNVFLDQFLSELGHAETKVILAIYRKTFGWHKAKEEISLSVIEGITGLKREHIIKASRSLEQKGMIRKEVSGPKGQKKTIYHLVILEDKNIHTSPVKGPDLVPERDYPPSPVKGPIKERATYKENKESAGAYRPPSANAEVPPVFSPSPRKSKTEPYKTVAQEVCVTQTQETSLLERLHGDLAKLKRCYDVLSAWKIGKGVTGGKSDYQAIIRWVIDSVGNAPEAKVGSAELKKNINKDFAEENVKLWHNTSHKISITPYGVDFYKNNGTFVTVIDFEDKAFKIKFNEEIKKRGFKK